MNSKKKLLLIPACLFLLFLLFLVLWVGIRMSETYTYWWNVVLFSSIVSLLLIILTCILLWHYIIRYMDSYFHNVENLLERHSNECPVRQEQLINTCMPVTEAGQRIDTFRRYFQSAHPMFVLCLRERVSNITPVEELLCMLIKMGLNNKETADRMSISLASLHTVRYRLKRKLPLPEGVQMDEWIRNIE